MAKNAAGGGKGMAPYEGSRRGFAMVLGATPGGKGVAKGAKVSGTAKKGGKNDGDPFAPVKHEKMEGKKVERKEKKTNKEY